MKQMITNKIIIYKTINNAINKLNIRDHKHNKYIINNYISQ